MQNYVYNALISIDIGKIWANLSVQGVFFTIKVYYYLNQKLLSTNPKIFSIDDFKTITDTYNLTSYVSPLTESKYFLNKPKLTEFR